MEDISDKFSDSDDDVCLGPYTLEEARKDWKRFTPRAIKKRHTISQLCNIHSDIEHPETTECWQNSMEGDRDNSGSSDYFSLNNSKNKQTYQKNMDSVKESTDTIGTVDSTISSYKTAHTSITPNGEDTINESLQYLDNIHLSLIGDTKVTMEESEESLVNLSVESSGNYGYDNSSEKANSPDTSGQKTVDNSFEFNDTLDEINRFLLEKEHASTENGDLPSEESVNSIHTHTKPHQAFNSKIPLYKYSPVSELSSKQNGDTFKIPMIPPKKVFTPITKSTSSQFKNVVSPVAIYINNSPKYFSMAKAKSPAKSVDIVPQIAISIKEPSTLEIPMANYKPSKIQYVQEEKCVKLPPSIKALLKTPIHIKHTRKITESQMFDDSIAKKLIGSSSLADMDISVLNIKQPYKL